MKSLLAVTNQKTNPKYFRYFFRRYTTNILLLTSFTVGMIFGAVCAGNADTQLISRLDFLFTSDFHARCNQTALYSFIASLTANFIFFTANILFGLSLWGMVSVPLLIGFKGFGISLTGGYLYKYYGFGGVGFFLLVILSGSVISTLALISQGKNTLQFSRTLLAKVKGTPSPTSQSMYAYIISNSFILIALSISSMIDAVLNTLFAGIFNFS